MTTPLITLTTDFGPGPFAGLMKGVILGICPQAVLVDISHAVPPQDVAAGCLVLEQVLDAFPPGSIHLGVVDPGVGTARKGMVLAAAGMLWVGPDNGLFSVALERDAGARAWELAEPAYFRQTVSNTFHGRDIFAPVAAHLARGVDPAQMGPPLTGPMRLEQPKPQVRAGALHGRVIEVDHFGNLGTDIPQVMAERFLAGRPGVATIREMRIPGPLTAYGQASPGQALALFNSSGRLELALNQGSLCRRLGLEPHEVFGLAVSLVAEAG